MVETASFISERATVVGDPAAEKILEHVNRQGGVTSDALDVFVREAGLPARHYAQVRALVAELGLILVADTPTATDEDAPDEPPSRSWDGSQEFWNGDGFGEFLKRSRHRILTEVEEVELGRAIERGRLAKIALDENPGLDEGSRRHLRREVDRGERAADDFALHNLRLVMSIAKAQKRSLGNSMDLQDLIQEGFIGLSHAIQKWDPRRGFKLSTYATWWIRQAIGRAIDNQARAIRVPVHVVDEVRRLGQAERLLQASGECTREALAKHLHWSEKKVLRIQALPVARASLDKRIGGRVSLQSMLADRGPSVEDEVLDTSRDDAIAQTLKAVLSEREVDVLVSRFGLGGRQRMTLEEIGKEYGLTRERIRQIESNAIKRLRAPAHSERLAPWWRVSRLEEDSIEVDNEELT